MGIEAFKALYPRGSDVICLDERSVPIGGWLAIMFQVGIIIVFGTIVEWAIWRGMVKMGPTYYVFEPTKR